MDITVLGSGSAIQFEQRASASFLIDTNEKKLLLDAGFHLLDRLERCGVMVDEIDAVYISHKHPDHFFGLLHMLFALKNKHYTPKAKLRIFGFKGLADWLNSFKKIMGHWLEPDMDIIISESTTGGFAGIEWEIFKTRHTPESTGVIIKSEGKKLVYSGDTEYFKGLKEKTEGADLFIAECGSGNNNKIKGHMCLNDLYTIAESSDIKNILTTHIYPETDLTAEEWTHNNTKFMRSYDHHKISI